jgi:hypothetical protein
MTRFLNRLLALSLLSAPVLAQLPAPSPNPPTLRAAPRATWLAVTSAGTTTNGALSGGSYLPLANTTFRADNPGAASNDSIYVFGGCLANNTATTANDLWKFDALAGTFTQLIADGAAGSPSHRGRASIAWNQLTNKLVVFGGNTRGGSTGAGTPTLLNDTWEYDPVTNTWTDVTPVSGNPSPRQHAAMCYEPVTGGMLMFGGQTNDASPHVINNETWLFLGGAWIQLTPATLPPARTQASLMTRTNFGDCVMCCGLDQTTYNNPPTNTVVEQIRFLDVWRWNGADWNLLSNYDVLTSTGSQGFPASAIGQQAIYDPLRKRIVMQGGNGHTVASNVTYLYGTLYGGSPTNWTSEFDCLTNSWKLYSRGSGTSTAAFGTNDSVLGRISRSFNAFVPATGLVYKICGQNPALSYSRPTYNVYSYQASPVASASSYGAGCNGLTLTADDLPWTNRTFTVTATGFGPLSFGLMTIGIGVSGKVDPGVPLGFAGVPGPGVGCNIHTSVTLLELMSPPLATTQTYSIPVPDISVDPTWVGLEIHMQAADLDFTAGWVGTYTSNGLTAIFGAL